MAEIRYETNLRLNHSVLALYSTQRLGVLSLQPGRMTEVCLWVSRGLG